MKRIIIILAVASFLLVSYNAHAFPDVTSSHWIGESGYWDDPTMWDPLGVPPDGDLEDVWQNFTDVYITPIDEIDRTINI